MKRIQRARYEQGLLALARAYVGYDIYFPALIYLEGASIVQEYYTFTSGTLLNV